MSSQKIVNVQNVEPVRDALWSIQDSLSGIISIADLRTCVAGATALACIYAAQAMTSDAGVTTKVGWFRLFQRANLLLLAVALSINATAPLLQVDDYHDLMALIVQIPLLGVLGSSVLLYRKRRRDEATAAAAREVDREDERRSWQTASPA